MDELRVQAYLALIQELLNSPGGEENEILNGHQELVDEGFVQVCEQRAAQLQGEGRENQAGFLRNVAQQVGAVLAREGMGGNETTPRMQNATSLLETLQQFINADTWLESQAYLTQHPELLGDEVDALLGQLIELAAGEERERRVLQEHRDLLQRCREIGIEQGFEEKLGRIRAERIRSAGAELPSELRGLVEDPQMRELLENPQLMGLMQDLFGALQESGTAPDDLETLLRSRLELMGRVVEMAMGGTGLGNLLNAESSGDVLTQFWRQLLQAEMQSGGDEAAVHQVMRQNMGLIVPDLGDTIAQFVQGYLAQNPDEAEDIAGLVENTCVSISDFPYGNYAEVQEIAIRGYGVVLELRADNPQKRAQTLTNLGVARYTQAEMGIDSGANLERAIAAYEEAAKIRRRLGLEKDLSTTLTNLGVARNTQAEMGIDSGANLERAIAAYKKAAEIRRRLGLARDLARTLNNLGFAYQAQSRLARISSPQKQQALENTYRSFQKALERVEYLRGEIGADSEGYKRNFNEEWSKVYRGMVEVCLELGRYRDALEYVDRSKARNLVELIATRDAYPDEVLRAENRQQLDELKIAIALEERRLQKNENPDPNHLNQLRQQKKELEPYKPLHFEGMQKLLDEKTAILEWYILGDKFLTFTLTQNPPLTPPSQGGEPEANPSEPPFLRNPSEPPFLRGAGGITSEPPFISEQRFHQEKSPFILNVQKEGIIL